MKKSEQNTFYRRNKNDLHDNGRMARDFKAY